ncbi:MAG: hypothetical protein J1E84_06730 [Muribaculaceae bacterium]|nr:hypothetical protein [Muribaculaceae bacterium]
MIKKNLIGATLLVALGSVVPAYAADAADMPAVITLKTNIFGYQGPENSFTIYLGSTESDCEFYVEGPKTQEYVYVNPYTLGSNSSGENSVLATAVTVGVTETDNTVTIYGDASKLDYIDIHGCYIGEVKLAEELTNLSVIDVSHNELREIDLSPFTGLNSIDLTDNQFAEPAKMKIGTNHPYLQLLQVGINDVVDPDLELKNFPNLQYFSGRNNYGITSIDPSGCPELVSLVLEVTNISTIDVSKNTKLDVLNLSNTRITNVDISKNVNLGEFYLSHVGSYNYEDKYKVSSIDVSKNTKLQYLDLSGNKLTTIDLTNNPNLLLLYLQHNQLAEIDLSKNTRLANVNLSNNLFTFATLPLPQAGWDYMYYRSPLSCNFKYKVNEAIDFSKEVIRAPYNDAQGNQIKPETYAKVFAEPRAGEVYEVDPALYTYSEGVTTFKEAVADSVYIEFFCTAFPDWTLRSRNFAVKTAAEYDQPSTVFTITPTQAMASQAVTFNMGLKGIAADVPAPVITISSGEAKLAEINATTSSTNAVAFTVPATPAAIEVKVTDGYVVTALNIADVSLASIDLTPSEFIKTLSVTGAGLNDIDLSFNRDLQSIDLSNNNLTSVDLTAVRGDFEKYYATDINLSNNKLTKLEAVNYDLIKNLNLANNQFAQFDAKYYTALRSFDISGNKLAGELDLSKVERLEELNASNNELTSITVNLDRIKSMNLAKNRLSFATLPMLSSQDVSYEYSPQQEVKILSAGAAINLSSQNVGDKGTTYVWRYADNKSVVPTTLYTLDNGVTRFNEDLIGKTLYCEMTNPAFPAFNANPLTTTQIKVLSKPDNLVASFTTTQSGDAFIGFGFANEGANAVYVDWSGDGAQYDEYLYDADNTDIYRTGRSFAGKTAKVYTYGEPSEVTNLYLNNTKLSSFDATPMTKAEAINIHNAGLKDGSIKLPQSERLYELVLDGNSFVNEQFKGYSNLSNLNLARCGYTKFDVSLYPNVMFLQISDNKIKEITFGNGNEALYQLDATGNQIEEIDLTGTNIRELLLADNNLTQIDLTPIKNRIGALNISGNYFRFSTLPRVEEYPGITYAFYYANQKPFEVECVDGNVDLSAEANIEGTATVYRWFLGDKQGDVYYDNYYEMFVGEELEGPDVSNDPEYTVTDGVTAFHYTQKRRVICAMTNELYPNLVLYTTPVAIDNASGVENVTVDNENQPVDVYNLSGIRVREQVAPNEALEGLAPGIYIVGSRKYIVR